MRGFIKRTYRVLLSALLALTMMMQAFSGLPFVSRAAENESPGYTELTYGNFGIPDGAYSKSTDSYIAPTTPVDTLDGTAITGYLNFSDTANQKNAYLRIGSADTTDNRASIKVFMEGTDLYFQHQDTYVTNTKTTTATEMTAVGVNGLRGRDAKVRITIDYQDQDVILGITIDEIFVENITMTGIAQLLGPHVGVFADESKGTVGILTITSLPAILQGSTLTLDGSLKTNVVTWLGDSARPEKEVTFSDFGISDGVVTNGSYSGGLTTWDKTTLTGYVTFGTSGILAVGNESGEAWTGIQLMYKESGDEKGLYITSPLLVDGAVENFYVDSKTAIIITNESADVNFQTDEIKLSLSFAYTVSGMDMEVVINDTFMKTVQIGKSKTTGMHVKDCLGMNLLCVSGLTVDSVGTESKTLTFSDCSIPDGVVTNGSYSTGLTTWDKVTLTGYVTLGDGGMLAVGNENGDNWTGIQLMYKESGDEKGLYIACPLLVDGATESFYVDGKGAIIITNESAGVNFQTDEIKLSLSFAYTGAGMDMKIVINDTYTQTVQLGKSKTTGSHIKDCLGMNLLCVSGVTVASAKPENKEVTFSDLGFSNGNVDNGTYPTGITSWDGVTLTGNVTFGTNGLFVIGHDGGSAWTGVQLEVQSDGSGLNIACPISVNGTIENVLINDSVKNIKITNAEAGVNFQTDKMKLTLTFIYTSSGMDMGVVINDILIRTVKIGNPSVGHIKDYLGENILSRRSPKVESVEFERKERSFADFGILDGVVENGTYSGEFSSWNGVKLTGNVTFGSNGLLVVGHDGGSAWTGVQLEVQSDGSGLKITSPLLVNGAVDENVLIDGTGRNIIITNAEAGVNFQTDEIKLSLTFTYTISGMDMDVVIDDNFVRTVHIGNPSAGHIKNYLGKNILSRRSPQVESITEGYMTFTALNTNVKTIPLGKEIEASKYGQSHYSFCYDSAAKELADNIELQYHYGSLTSSKVQYSVKDYAETIIADEATYGTKAVALAEALLDYGSAAQQYFKYHTDNLANPNFNGNTLGLTADELKTYAKNKQTHNQIATLTSTNLVLESETTLKMYFTFAEGVSRDNFTFTDATGNVLEPIALDGRYCVVFENIKAHELDKNYSVTITNNDDNSIAKTYSYSALSYCYVALNYGKENLANLAKALFLYNQAAESYVIASDEVSGYVLKLDGGTWTLPEDAHLQGVTKDDKNEFIYYSFTDRLVKVNMRTGQMVASVNLFESAHLGDLAYYDGMVYGSLNCDYYKYYRPTDKMHVARFDVSEMTEMNMDYQDIMTTISIDAVNRRDGTREDPTGYDGITFGPMPGDNSGDIYMILACDLAHSDKTNHAMFAYNVKDLEGKFQSLTDPTNPHRTQNLSPSKTWYFYLGYIRLAAQTLEYNAEENEYWLTYYQGEQEGYLNAWMYVIDASKAPTQKQVDFGTSSEPGYSSSGSQILNVQTLTLKEVGTYHESTGVWGITELIHNVTVGFIPLGNDYFYIGYNGETDGKQYGYVRLFKFNRTTSSFALVQNDSNGG